MHLLTPGRVSLGNSTYQEFGCWHSNLIDLGRQTWVGSLVYYEAENLSDPGYIAMDWVIVYVSANLEGSWKLVFYWGDGYPGNNGNIPPGQSRLENDGQRIASGDLFNQTGIQIGVGGYYRYVLISAPPRCDDPAQAGAIDVLP
jgi:hypothetical protein